MLFQLCIWGLYVLNQEICFSFYQAHTSSLKHTDYFAIAISIQSHRFRIFGYPFCSIMLYCIYTMESRWWVKASFWLKPHGDYSTKIIQRKYLFDKFGQKSKTGVFLCATLLVPAFKRNNFASSSPTSVKLCKQKKPLDTVSPFPQGNGFSDSVSFHLYNSNGRPKKKDHKHDISSSQVPTQFIKKVEADLGQPCKRSPEVYLGLPRIRTAPNRQQFNFKLAHTVSWWAKCADSHLALLVLILKQCKWAVYPSPAGSWTHGSSF